MLAAFNAAALSNAEVHVCARVFLHHVILCCSVTTTFLEEIRTAKRGQICVDLIGAAK